MTDNRAKIEATHSPCAIMITSTIPYGGGSLVFFTKTYPLNSMLPGKKERRVAFFGEEPGMGTWDMSCG